MADDRMSSFQRAFTRKGAFWMVLIAALIADLATKAWADAVLRPTDPEVHTVIPGVLAWKWATNEGAAFSIFEGRPYLLATIASVVLLIVFFQALRTHPKRWFFLVALALVAAGAMGNLYDRVLLGHVRDFIYYPSDLPFHGHGFGLFGFDLRIPQRWPVWNVADMEILFGVGMLIVLSFKDGRPKKADKEDDDGA